MRCDLEEIPLSTSFESDVCVVGGGIAGLILASKLGALGKTVHLLEAGGPKDEPRSQELYAGEMAGVHHRGTTEGRHRLFGGSSTRWAAQLLPYPDEVFKARAAVEHVGWPISGKDLAGYYPEIHRIMRANDLPFDDSFPEQVGALPCRSTEAVRVRFSKWAPFANRNLAKTEGKKCLGSERVTVFFHANALAFTFNADGTEVSGVSVKNYQGVSFAFKAKQYVIATGTIETSRLLLNSSSICAAGAGNENDLVGRYFFDHVACEVGKISGAAFPLYKKYFAPYYLKRTMHTARFETSAALQEKLRILAVMGHFEFEEAEGSGLIIFRRFLHDIQRGRLAQEDGQPLSTLPKALLGGMQTVYDLKVRGRRIPTPQARISLRFDMEQKPCAESRILLSPQRDALGARKLVVDWRRSDEESESMHKFSGYMDAFLKNLGVELQWHDGLLEGPGGWGELGIDCFHPMGGTRMGTSPTTSVVDPHLRVHGISNLYVDSCAVYPTGGSSNPTFTLMALTLRLAHHLAQLR
jgi:choline dehydrogenase-like flavoprotein